MTSTGKHQYPLMEHASDTLQAASGRPLSKINLDAVANGDLSITDLGVSADTLRAQAEIARRAGYTQLAANLLRAAELTAVPNDELLQMYEMLRPGRCTYDALMGLAEKLEVVYNAPESSRFVQEAASVYRTRGLLRRIE